MKTWEALVGSTWHRVTSEELLRILGEPKLIAYRRAGQASLELKPVKTAA